mmetsp:Transcript_39519/g.93818  ORF Transcript_39519/g.93818 Transcript_39519/m.93818 type:complete len:205 (-) Transcript_39519:54-668(-)
MLPNPLRSASPTSACLRAPTSLPPSPHMSVPCPHSFRALITSAFPSGDIRANTRIESMCRQISGCAAAAAASVSPVTMRSLPRPRAGRPAALKGSLRLNPEYAPSHSKAPVSLSCLRSSAFSLAPLVMQTSLATWRAVSGASPVIMAVYWPASTLRAAMTADVSLRDRHENATNPENSRRDSAHSLGLAAASLALAASSGGMRR